MEIVILLLLVVQTLIVRGGFRTLANKLEQVMATQKDAADQLNAVAAELAKANAELQAKIQALTDAANAADTVSPELQTAIDGVTGAAKTIDDIVPDAPPPAA